MNDHAGWTQDLKCVLCGSDDAAKPCTGLPELVQNRIQAEADYFRKVIAKALNVEKELENWQGQLLADQLAKEEAKIIQDLQFVKNAIKNVCENNVLKECSSPTGQHEYVDEEVEGSYSLYCIHCYSSHP